MVVHNVGKRVERGDGKRLISQRLVEQGRRGRG